MGFFTNRYGDIRIFRTGAIIVATGILALGILGRWANNFEYSEGTRVGVINKFSRKGIIWKTYEGQMALEGIVSSGGVVGANTWDFGLDNQARHGEDISSLVQEIRDSAESSTKVRVTYKQPLHAWPWRGGTSYFIQTIEPLNTTPEATQ